MKKLLLTLLISTSLIGTSLALTFVNNNSNSDAEIQTAKKPIDQDSILASKLEKRRTINVFRAWDTPGTLNDVFKYHYGLYWVPNPETPLHTIGIIHLNWHMNYQSSEWDDYDGIEEFILKKDWLHEEEYPTADIIKFWDDDFAEYISDVSHKLVNQNQSDAYGVMLDWWRDEGGVLASTGLSSARVKKARTAIAAKLREKLGNDAVILGNVNWDLNIATTQFINGVFLELWKKPGKERYTANDIKKMEDSLYFYDKYLQEPRIIAMAPWRVSKKGNSALIPRDAEENIRYAKLFAAMAMVIPENGYILYSDNNWDELDGFDYGHQYYDFYNIDLGKATSKVIEVTKGVAYKKHQNGYIAFNRLGYDVTVDFGDFQSVVPSMEGVFLNEDGTPYVGCEDGFIKKNGICEIDNSPLFSDDFENDVRVNNWLDNWSVRQDPEGNSIYCNETSSDWASFKFGRDDWTDYSVSLRMKFPTGYSRAEIYFRINQQWYGYRLSINAQGHAELGYWSPPHINLGRVLVPVKRDEWMQIQLIFSGNNLKFLFDGEVVTEINDDKRKNGLAGFGVPPNSEVCVDDIVVKKVTKVETKKVTKVETKKVNPDGKKISKYQNGKTKSEEHYKDGKKEGKFTTWYQSGEIKSEINYKNNLREGKGTSWYVNGKKKAETNYKNSKKEGKSTVWYQSGQKKSEANYKDNTTDGKRTMWYENGQKKSEGNYKAGNAGFTDISGLKEGKFTTWYENGQIKLEENYIDNKREGKRTMWYENGQVMYKDNFKDGKLDGKKIHWHDNGQIKNEVNYKDGKLDGKKTEWYEDGQIKSEINY